MKIRYCVIVFISLFLLFTIGWPVDSVESNVNYKNSISESASGYQLHWPGILPDRTFLYKLKVLRNKIIAKIIYSPVKRIEFDLLMVDKTLYAGKLMFDKGKYALAKETVLKGENYFGILVTDYSRAKYKKEYIPKELTSRIILAHQAHQELIHYLTENSPAQDKKVYQDIKYFSDENYRIFLELQQK